MNGIVRLEDLSGKYISVKLETESENSLRQKIKETGNVSKFLRMNIIEALKIEIQVAKIRGKQGISINYKDFDFTTDSGVRLIASLIGDGTVHKKGIRYYNQNKNLIKLFVQDAKCVFGDDIQYKIYKNKDDVYAVSLPNIFKEIILITGLESGSKITNEQKIPEFIFYLSKEKLSIFISKLIDDEGYFSHGRFGIDMAFANGKEPHLLLGIQRILKILEIGSLLFTVRDTYQSSKGKDRQMWRLKISQYPELEKLCKIINLHNMKKSKLSMKILVQKRRTRRDNIFYINEMKEIQREKGFFTLRDLSSLTSKSERQIYRVLLNAQRGGLIEISDEERSVANAKCVVVK